MDTHEGHDLDAIIEEALCRGPVRPVPTTLLGKIRKRLTIVSLIRQERQWFRYSMAAGGALVASIAVAFFLLIVFRQLLLFVFSGVPGFLGYFDYLVNSTTSAWRKVFAILAIILAVPIAAIFLAAILPRRLKHS